MTEDFHSQEHNIRLNGFIRYKISAFCKDTGLDLLELWMTQIINSPMSRLNKTIFSSYT